MKDFTGIEFADVLKLAGLVIGAFWGGLPALTQLLAIVMVVDVVTGLMSAGASGVLSSEVSKKGMFQKTMIVALVGLAMALDTHLKKSGIDAPFNVTAMVSGFYIVHELISIIENAACAGLPVPQVLVDLLAKFPGGNKAELKVAKITGRETNDAKTESAD
ncbi:MAG: phage holin family protein [Anaerolineae bacterium]